MTEHRSVGTVVGYFQAGGLLASRATTLLSAPDAPTLVLGASAGSASTPPDPPP